MGTYGRRRTSKLAEIEIFMFQRYIKKKLILEFLNFKYDAGKKLEILDKAFEYDKNKISEHLLLPELEGDKCTFIGSTFLRLGDKELIL